MNILKIGFRRVLAQVAAVVLILGFATALTSCGESGKVAAEKGTKGNPIVLGVVGASDEQWPIFKEEAEKQGIYVELKNFGEYSEVNPATVEGAVDVNEFQHIQYLAKYIATTGNNLVPYAATAVFPISLWGSSADGVKSLEDIKDGSQIAIPNDGTNQSRAILLLENAGLVKLHTDHKAVVVPSDIDETASKVKILPVVTSQTPISLSDPQVAAAVVNNDFVKNISEESRKKPLYTESAEAESAKPYINIFATTDKNINNEAVKKLGEIFASPSVQEALITDSGGADFISTSVNKLSQSELESILAQQVELVKASAQK
ncbi:MAG: ABC transporter substrate-binding protein [Candidatus Ancillula sp.]|jgi:D-methionine transport system substrate-binding protein|nr:ABC transporter substrate-binding protein [Candidatus Ancillula sp.]